MALVQLDNCGPWTVSPESRRKADLQSMQTRSFAGVSEFPGSRGGYTFASRYDRMLAVTNDVSRDDHTRLQATVQNRNPMTVGLGVGRGLTSADASLEAKYALKEARRRDHRVVLTEPDQVGT